MGVGGCANDPGGYGELALIILLFGLLLVFGIAALVWFTGSVIEDAGSRIARKKLKKKKKK